VKPATTVQLRLRGLTPLALVTTVVAALPVAIIAWHVVVHKTALAQSQLPLAAFAAAGAALPWLSRALARAGYRAKLDDVALHVRGEALPWKTIKRVTVERTLRRTTLKLVRSETITLELVLDDAFAGRLQPRDELARHLREHGHDLESLLRS
jgi:hypothetical protein